MAGRDGRGRWREQHPAHGWQSGKSGDEMSPLFESADRISQGVLLSQDRKQKPHKQLIRVPVGSSRLCSDSSMHNAINVVLQFVIPVWPTQVRRDE
jgi:hypothetical protein